MTIGRVQVHRWPARDHIGRGLSPDDREVVEGPLVAPELPSDPADAPVAAPRPVVDWLAGPDSELHIVEGARHELSNAQTVESVVSLAERGTAS
jgi:hypothetical protein